MEENILERKGCPIHYWLGGPADRPLVVLTHGACVDHRSFDRLVPELTGEYRVLCWDVRGHGLSQPMAEAFNVPLAVEDLLALVDRLGYQQAVFIGHSNGTYIHQELAFRHPERVRAMVIADGTSITWKRSGFENWITRVSGDLMALFPYETLKKAGLPSISANLEVQAYAYQAYSMLTRQDFITIWKGVTACLHEETDDRLSQPVLLTHGDQDISGDIRKVAPLWAANRPNFQYVVIPNARHFAILDNPQFFNQLVLDFLKGLITHT